MIVVGVVVIVVVMLLAYAARCRWFPTPEPWSQEDELVAMTVALSFHVTLEEARLAVLAWR